MCAQQQLHYFLNCSLSTFLFSFPLNYSSYILLYVLLFSVVHLLHDLHFRIVCNITILRVFSFILNLLLLITLFLHCLMRVIFGYLLAPFGREIQS
uniref:Uncharacterized protein n=1 Tax=Octopus bimaculoides TaxID=37653 RepID=A0A0L8HD27_OCTBM